MKNIAVLYIIAFTFSCSFCQNSKIKINSKAIDDYMSTAIKQWKIPGCAIAIVKGDQLIYAKGYGYRDVENKLPVTAGTIFKIASCTKSFTAAAAGLLVYQKYLDWDIPVKKYLPELEFSNAGLTDKITLRDLLTHRTGILDDDWSWVGDHIDVKRMYEILSVMPLRMPLRSGFIYNNMAYALAGCLSGSISKTSWRNLVRKFFFEPLSMSSSLFSHNELSGLNDFAYGYEWNDLSKSFTRGNLSEHLTDSLSVCEAFAFISTSAVDLSKWIRLFINGGKWQGKQIIPGEIFRELVKPVNYMHAAVYPELSESYYCMGWEKNYYKKHPLLQHSGGLTGFKSYMSYMPEDSIGIIVLTNGQPYRFAEAASYDLYDMVLGLQQTNWYEKLLPGKKTGQEEKPKADTLLQQKEPCKPLNDYTGIYFSKWLGRMKIESDGSSLLFYFHSYPCEKMRFVHYNTFIAESGRVTFQLNHDGAVTGMLLNEYEFTKIK